MKKSRFLYYKSTLIAICLALMLYTVALAASGDLDTTFSGDGRVIQGFGGNSHLGSDVTLQADGKVVAVGSSWFSGDHDFAIARYKTDGSLDTTFSGDGRQVINFREFDESQGVAIQTDGRIVVGGVACAVDGGNCVLALARLNPNGTLDTTFSGDGKLITAVGLENGGWELALQGNKIVVAGYVNDGTSFNGAVYRYNSNGSLDSTFSGDGILPVNFGADEYLTSIVVDSGKIYIAGWSGPSDGSSADFIVARINSNGTLDTAFSGDGKIKTNLGGYDSAYGMAVSSDKVVVAGMSDRSMYGGPHLCAITVYTSSGALDSTFSGDGKLKTSLGFPAPSISDVVFQGQKFIVVGRTGSNGNAFLARYLAGGSLDSNFGTSGIVTTDWGGHDWYNSVVFGNSRISVVGGSRTISGVTRFIIAAYEL